MPAALSVERQAAILAGLERGESVAAIAAEVGCYPTTVRAVAQRHGVEIPPSRFAPLTAEQRAKIARMLADGWTYRQIAQGVGCTAQTVQRIASKLGVDRSDVARAACACRGASRRW